MPGSLNVPTVAESMFRIGEFARFTRVSAKMLRHWDETGLLRPARVDPATGYRYYGVDQLPRLNRIVLLRDLGFGLEEIGELLHDDLDEIYARRERMLAAEVERAQGQLRAVRARRELMREGRVPADVVVRPVESMLVATLTGAVGQDVGELFYRLETHVRAHGARAGRPPLSILPEPDDETVTVAVPLTWLIPPVESGDVRLLHAVPRMACAVHRGGYDGLPGLLQRMLRWLQHAGEQPAGRIREVYLRFGAESELGLPPSYLTDQRANLVTELQVPVQAATA
jgi:DNA-binding transcriptional MerR regulator